MDLSGCYFIYNGTPSRKYGLIFANADTDRLMSLHGDVDSVTVYNKSGTKNYFIGESLESSPLVFDAEVITDNDRGLDMFTKRLVEKWLFRTDDYCKLYIDMTCDVFGETYEIINGEQKQLYLNCRFTNPEKIEANGGIVGYKFTVECDSRMAWQDAVTYNYTFNSTGGTFGTTFDVEVDTDILGFVYPKVVIHTGTTGGDIIISNITDDSTRTTRFTGLTPNIVFTMNGNGINYVSGDNYLKFSSRNFIRLKDGTNTLQVYGDVTGIDIEFQNQRYL